MGQSPSRCQRFAKAFGEPEDKRIPAKEYIEKKLAELEAGEFRAETLGEVLSRDEVDPDVLVPHWDAKGHLSVKKGSSSVAMPTGPEQLRLRLTVITWPLDHQSLENLEPKRPNLRPFHRGTVSYSFRTGEPF